MRSSDYFIFVHFFLSLWVVHSVTILLYISNSFVIVPHLTLTLDLWNIVVICHITTHAVCKKGLVGLFFFHKHFTHTHTYTTENILRWCFAPHPWPPVSPPPHTHTHIHAGQRRSCHRGAEGQQEDIAGGVIHGVGGRKQRIEAQTARVIVRHYKDLAL